MQHETQPHGKSEGAEHGRASRRRGSGIEEQAVVTKDVSRVLKFRKNIRTHSAILSRSSFGISSSMFSAIRRFSFASREPQLLCTTHSNNQSQVRKMGTGEEGGTFVKGQKTQLNGELDRRHQET